VLTPEWVIEVTFLAVESVIYLAASLNFALRDVIGEH
jgi:hypothetical protein